MFVDYVNYDAASPSRRGDNNSLMASGGDPATRRRDRFYARTCRSSPLKVSCKGSMTIRWNHARRGRLSVRGAGGLRNLNSSLRVRACHKKCEARTHIQVAIGFAIVDRSALLDEFQDQRTGGNAAIR